MKHVGRKVGVSAAVAAALVLCMGVGTAFAGANNTTGKDTNWTIPTHAMTNTIEKDGTTYKVITTWANAWATGGPDYIGISNSCYLPTQGGGTSSAGSLEQAQTQTLLGVWASVANESPNAYNWNTLWNLYCNSTEGLSDPNAVEADFATASNSWNSTSGVWGAFDFRPELIYTSNGLSADNVSKYVKYINDGQYVDNGGANPEENPDAYDPDDVDKSKYYIDGDETYDPYVFSANNQNAYSYTDTFYNLADVVDWVTAEYADYDGTETDWKGMNADPRISRYEEVGLSSQDCAMNIERITRGSIYYVLEQLAENNVTKKKVAYLESAPSTGSSSVKVIAFDYIENIGNGPCNGYASFSPTIVDQLIADDPTTKQIATSSTVGANSSSTNNDAKGSDLYGTESTATADQLLDCDFIYVPNGSMDQDEVKTWLSDQATSADKDSKLEKVEISAYGPSIIQWSNFTAEKLVYGTYAVNIFYPELFPDLELLGYWYDEVYHLTDDALPTAMTYCLGYADLPEGLDMSQFKDNYSKEHMEALFDEGLTYYIQNYDKDETISRIASGTPLSEGVNKDNHYEMNGFAPSAKFLRSGFDANQDDAAYVLDLTEYLATLDMGDDVDFLQLYVDALKVLVGDLDDGSLAAAIESLEATIEELRGTIGTQQGTIGSLETTISGLNDTIANLQQTIEEMTQSSANDQATIDELTKQIEDLNKQLEEATKGTTASPNTGGTTSTPKAAAAQKITAKKSVKAKKGKKATIKVKGAKTALKVTAKGKAKKALKVTVKKGKIVVKAKKKGTYKVQVYAAASSSYAKSNTVTVKVKVK